MNHTLPVSAPLIQGQERVSRETVAAFLLQFSNRKTMLSILRGISVAITTLLACSLVIVAVDATSLLSDTWRWTMTCVAYALASATGWKMGLRSVSEPISRENIAWEVEQACPSFRESLLSSVELRTLDGTVRSGSPQFLSEIEQRVAQELNGIEVESLLPWKLVATYALSAIAFLASILGLCCIPMLQFPERWARAMLPFVSLTKPSTIQIAIVEPNPASLSVPADQVVSFAVEIGGGRPTEAILELVEIGKPVEVDENSEQKSSIANRAIKMNLESESPLRFGVSAPIGNRKTQYRILAGDAVTTYRTITPIPRPKPIAFHLTTQSPEYAMQEVAVQTNLRGDIKALQGSRVVLEIDVNQRLSAASIAMEYSASGKRESIPLVLVKPSPALPLATGALARYSATLEVEQNSRYQLKLQSDFEFRGTRIENSFSPYYRIDVLVDSPAVVEWNATDATFWNSAPKPNETYIVAPDEIVSMAALVTDNLPLDSISQEISVNRGEWLTLRTGIPVREFDPESTTESNGMVAIRFPSKVGSVLGQSDWVWDLIELTADTGDTIATRIAAVDRKGNASYSPIIQFSLASLGFDRDRHQGLMKRSILVAPIVALHESLVPNRGKLRPLLDRLRDLNLPADQLEAATKELKQSVENAIAKANAVRTVAQSVMPEVGICVDQNEVELAVRLASRTEKDFLECIRQTVSMDIFQSKPIFEGPYASWHQQDRDEKLNRMIQSHDWACDSAQRLLDIYRQFIGLELQAALTKDLTYLMQHQQSVLTRKPESDFATLTRSQQVADQYMEAIAKLAHDMEPNVNQDVKDRFQELYRWLDLTKSEIHDIVQEEDSDQTRKKLRARIERSANELKNVRWAFNLGGNLIWTTIESRKELLNRSGPLWTNFEQFFAKNQKRRETLNDKNLPSDEVLARLTKITTDATGPLFTSIGQMLDRRDIHQRRSLSDPMFASDMGMAHRAWTSVLEQWVAEPTRGEELLLDLQAIAKAYRILESAHETEEAKMAVHSLRPLEQFEWKSMNAQLLHTKQWDSVNFRLEIAQQWMREAGFPAPVADKFNGLRWTEPAQRMSAIINPRRDPNNPNLESGADELMALLKLWSEADALAKPTIEEARSVLAKFAPSVSELAQKAAESTKQLKELTEKLQSPENRDNKQDNAADANRTKAVPTEAKIQSQRDEAELKTARLQDALIELAGKQNLLTEKELETAKDSDSALKLIDAVTLPMNESLKDALQLSSELKSANKQTAAPELAAEAAEKIEKAIHREQSAVQALERVAEHFALLSQSSDGDKSAEIQKSREELEKLAEVAARELAQEPEAIPLRDDSKDYEQAEKLAQMAGSDPETLLKKLEQELKTNPSMQKELSEISKANAQSVSSDLKNASKTEQAMAKQLENSDLKLAGEKKLQMDQLKSAADQAERFAARLMNKASQAASRSGKQDQASPIDVQAQQLRNAANAAKQLGEDATRAEIAQAAQSLSQQLTASQKQIEASTQSISPTVEEAKTKEEQQRQNLRNDAQNNQNQSREEILNQARDALNQSQQVKNQTKQRADEFPGQLANARKQKQDAKANLEKNPDNQGAKDWFQNAANQEEQLVARKMAAEQIAKQAEGLAEKAQKRLSQFEQAEKSNLDKPNPNAALALEQLSKAQGQVEAIQAQVQSAMEGTKQLPQPKSNSTELTQKETQQTKVQEKVADASQELTRSARHEERLGNNEGAKGLSELAKMVDKSSKGSVQSAKEQLNQSAANAKQSESDQAKQSKDGEIATPFERPQTQLPQQTLNQAGQELSDTAKKIEDAVGEKDSLPNSGKPPKPNTANNESPNGRQPQSPAQPSGQPQSGQPQSGQPQSGQPQSGQPQSGPNSLAREQQQTEAKELARMLDDLDRLVNSSDALPVSEGNDSSTSKETKQSPQNESQPGQPKSAKSSSDNDGDRSVAKNSFRDSLQSSADKLASAMNQDRLSQRSASEQAKNNSRNDTPGKQSKGRKPGRDLAKPEMGGTFTLPSANREPSREWGKLREQRAEDVVEGRRDEYDPEFSQAIQAYYKAMRNR